MSKIIEGYVKQFKPSNAVFNLVISNNGAYLNAVHVGRDNTLGINTDDPIAVLVASNFYESFLIGSKRFEINSLLISYNVLDLIKEQVMDFYALNSGLKKPKQSKIYKWLSYGIKTDLTGDGLVMLYRYMHANCDLHIQTINSEHTQNALAILELMGSKHDK